MLRIFLIEGAIVGVVGSLLGGVIGAGLSTFFAHAVKNPYGESLFPIDLTPAPLPDRGGGGAGDRAGLGLVPGPPRGAPRPGAGDPRWLTRSSSCAGWSRSTGTSIRTRVLHGLDLRVEPGEFTALIGPSGSGKSTLLNLIGLLDRPTEGRLFIAGQETGALDDDGLTRYRGRSIGFVFQFHHLLPEFIAPSRT